MDYTKYLAENINSISKYYSEYISKNIDKNFKYTEYLAENIDKSIEYSEYMNLFGVKDTKSKLRKLRKQKLKSINDKI